MNRFITESDNDVSDVIDGEDGSVVISVINHDVGEMEEVIGIGFDIRDLEDLLFRMKRHKYEYNS